MIELEIYSFIILTCVKKANYVGAILRVNFMQIVIDQTAEFLVWRVLNFDIQSNAFSVTKHEMRTV
jgi:hypothetical protein